MEEISNCKLCGSEKVFDFFQLPPVPTQDGVMFPSEEEAVNAPKGNIDLRFCKDCGFIRNEAHDPSKIGFDDYDFSNDQSPLFRAYIDDLCYGLIEKYGLFEKTILDIGCGDGIFLKTICEKGNNRGIGMDPGFDHSNRSASGADVTFRREYYSAEHKYLEPDFIACRLVIDLLPDPRNFLETIRGNLEDDSATILYFEVPNATYTFAERVIWNVVYEHSVWFTPASFAYMFELCGFEVLHVSPCWNDEFLGIEVRPRSTELFPKFPDPKSVHSTLKAVELFSSDFNKLMSQSRRRIERIRQTKQKTIAWGAGARAVTFFNLFDIKYEVPFVVDINDKRHGKYLPGSGQRIVAPEFIVEYQPDFVIITNPTYAEEIRAHIKELGVYPKFWVL